MADASDIVPVAEPFFTSMNAKVDMVPVMDADDLKTGLSKLS